MTLTTLQSHASRREWHNTLGSNNKRCQVCLLLHTVVSRLLRHWPPLDAPGMAPCTKSHRSFGLPIPGLHSPAGRGRKPEILAPGLISVQSKPCYDPNRSADREKMVVTHSSGLQHLHCPEANAQAESRMDRRSFALNGWQRRTDMIPMSAKRVNTGSLQAETSKTGNETYPAWQKVSANCASTLRYCADHSQGYRRHHPKTLFDDRV